MTTRDCESSDVETTLLGRALLTGNGGRSAKSNEELSIARAFNVRDYLTQLDIIPANSIALTGYGDIKPVASNVLPEGRRKNRRVEIILKNQNYI